MQSRSRGREAQLELLSGGGDRVALERHEYQQVRVRFVQRAQPRPQSGIDTERVGIQARVGVRVGLAGSGGEGFVASPPPK